MRFKDILETYSLERSRGYNLGGKMSTYHNTFIKYFYGRMGKLTSQIWGLCDPIPYNYRYEI